MITTKNLIIKKDNHNLIVNLRKRKNLLMVSAGDDVLGLVSLNNSETKIFK